MKVKTLLIVAALVSAGPLSAQQKHIKVANKKYANENYAEAAEKCALAYTKIIRKTAGALKTKADMAWKTAESYRLTENYKDADSWYEKAILLKYQETDPIVYLRKAEVLMNMHEYKDAAKYFGLYKSAVPGDIRGENGLKSADDAIKDVYREDRSRHEVSKVGSLNKSGFEMAPALIDKKGTLMAFSSTRQGTTGSGNDPRTGEPYMDIYTSKIDAKGNFGAPELLDGKDVNTVDNEGTISVDARGKTMFFTRCPNEKKKNLGCEIWMSEAKGKGWDSPVKVPGLKANDSISVGHPLISDDGMFLIFVSDFQGEGSQGGHDLWYTTYNKKSDSWAPPVNMGPEINTPGDEMFPSYDQKGDLFYSSTGMPGMGGLDIFRAQRVGTDNKWENPKNIGAPINSEFNDYGILEMQEGMKMGIYTSERKDSEGGQFKPDLYKFILPPNIFTLKVGVNEPNESKIPGVEIILTNKTTNEVIKGVTGPNGEVYWDKKANGDRVIAEESDYTIQISKPGYHEVKTPAVLSTKKLKYNQDFVLDLKLIPKKPIRLREVRYPLAKWSLLVDSTINSKDSLNQVYELLTEYPNMVLELSSHTDSRGSANLNQVLSDNRAHSCYEYLVKEKGIDPRRIVPIGRGENEPRTVYLIDGKYVETEVEGSQAVKLTEAYINQFKKTDPKKFELLHQFNRRTEGKVLSMDFDPATAPPANPKYLEFQKLPTR